VHYFGNNASSLNVIRFIEGPCVVLATTRYPGTQFVSRNFLYVERNFLRFPRELALFVVLIIQCYALLRNIVAIGNRMLAVSNTGPLPNSRIKRKAIIVAA